MNDNHGSHGSNVSVCLLNEQQHKTMFLTWVQRKCISSQFLYYVLFIHVWDGFFFMLFTKFDNIWKFNTVFILFFRVISGVEVRKN